jgi:hypothetical protein
MNLFEKYPKATIAALVILITLAGMRIYRAAFQPPPGKVVSAYYDSVSDQVRQAAKHVKKGANVVVLVFDAEMRSQNNEPLKRMIKTLKEENLNIQHVERLVMDVSKGWSDTIPGFPYDEYLRVAREYPQADAILSLCSAPYSLPPMDKTDVSSLPPLLLARAVPRSEGLSHLIDHGWVAMAVVLKEQEGERNPPGSLFGDKYEVLSSKGF